MDTINRLQFRHHDEIFTGATLDEARAAAIGYISGATAEIRNATTGLAVSDDNNFGVGTKYGYSLFSEPTILRYSTPGSAETDPHIILAIGSVTNDKYNETGELWHSNNKFCIIDIDKTEGEIEDLREEIEKIIKSLNIITIDSDSLDLESEWIMGEGIYLSGDVKTTDHHAFSASGGSKPNSLMIASANTDTGSEGLFIYVDLKYDESTETFTFYTSLFDGTLKEVPVKLPNNYLVSGEYKKEDESIHLHMKNGDEVVVNCEDLIAEWYVEGDASKTPIVLTREEVEYDGTPEHHHVEPWQDVLRADVRIANDRPANILKKTVDGRYLYVDGEAENIRYEWNGEVTNVDEQLNRLNMTCRVSPDSDNIIRLEDGVGFFANATLNYIPEENKLIFVTSCVNGGEIRKEIQLNTVDVIQSITYDPTTEELVIKYVNDKGEVKTLRVPMSGLIDEWTVLNDAHSVYLKRQRNLGGADVLTADVNISERENNILEEVGEGNLHMLYVKGTADNIKYKDTTVEGALDDLAAEDEAINEKLDQEIARSTAEDEKIETTIGSGFTTDAHETITYKFEQLTEKVDDEIARSTAEDERIDAKLDEEIERSTGEDERIDAKLDDEIARSTAEDEKIETTIGSGFSTDAHETVTYKFDQLQEQVNSEAEKLQNEIDRSTAKDDEHDERLDVIDAEIGEGFNPRNTVRDEIDNLQSEIDAVSADTSMRLTDIINEDESIDVETRNDAAGKPTVKVVKANLSTEVEDDRKNIIKLNSDGLFANVDLSYIEEANKLIFHTSNGEPDKEIQLESMSSIIDIRYDAAKEAIIITYMTNGHEIKTVEIPVGDLINEWRVEDGHPHAVQLEKVRIASGTTEQDVLKASVIITDDHDDNILVMDDGALYVPANTNVTEALREAIEAETIRASEAESVLDNAIATEELRATSAETALQTSIDTEKARAIAAESELNTTLTTKIEQTATALSAYTQTSVNEEKTRAMTVEGELRQAIQDETARANAADQLLQDAIDDEVARSIEKDVEHDSKIAALQTSAATLNSDINSERTRATSAETALQTAIENEKARAMNAESELNTTLTSKIEQAATALSAYTRTAVNEEQTRAMTVEGELRQAIQDETARANAADQLLQDAIDDEVARSTAKDDEHDLKISALETSAVTLSSEINAERVRATSAETSLSTAINNETTRATNAESTLNTNLTSRISETATNLSAYTRTAVNEEQTRAMTAEGELRTAIVAETERANAADTVLSGNIQTVAESVSREEARARQAEADIQGNIDDNKIEFEDTTSINFDSHQPTVGVGSVITAEVKLHDADDNLIKCGQGLYATARLDYNSGTNKIKLITSAGEQEFQLSAGAIIDNIYFDENTGELVITYHNAEGSQTVKFGVSELFNPWIVQNPSSGSAIELVKTPAASQGDPDELSARVLLTNLDDNAVKIVNNGLYVSSSAMTGAEEIAKCAKAELKGVEKAVIGHTIADCDSGYTYEPWTIANYISGATSFNNADFILDQSIKNVENKVDDVIEDVNCVDSSAKKLYELLYGQSTSMPDCGEGVVYTPDLGSCVISGATSFMDADKKLGDQICEILEMWVSGMTCTTLTDWVDEGANKKMLVDVRPSYGKDATMTSDDLYITDLTGKTIEHGVTEFTDTNALRIVCLEDGGSVIPDIASKQNGVYLSNAWNCGKYYQESTEADEMAEVEADGYNVNYFTDESTSGATVDYSNYLRR